MPDELSILQRRCWTYHAVDPLQIPETLIDCGWSVVEESVHVEIIRPADCVNHALRLVYLVLLTPVGELSRLRRPLQPEQLPRDTSDLP